MLYGVNVQYIIYHIIKLLKVVFQSVCAKVTYIIYIYICVYYKHAMCMLYGVNVQYGKIREKSGKNQGIWKAVLRGHPD